MQHLMKLTERGRCALVRSLPQHTQHRIYRYVKKHRCIYLYLYLSSIVNYQNRYPHQYQRNRVLRVIVMKQLFGSKKNTGGSQDRSATGHGAPPYHGSSNNHHNNNSSNSKAQPLIETLRSADTVSATPSSSSSSVATSNFSYPTPPTLTLPAVTNQQQTNKKLFGINSRSSRKDQITAAQQRQPSQSQSQQRHDHHQPPDSNQPVIGYTASVDPTDHLSTTTSFSNVSLMVPPSQQRLHHHQKSASRKLPPETIVATSQQQYLPPSALLATATVMNHHHGSYSTDADDATFRSNTQSSTTHTLTYPRRSPYRTTEYAAPNSEDYHATAATTMTTTNLDHDGIDQEHYNRLLATTTTTTNPNTSSTNNDDDDDDIVPFTSHPHNHDASTTVRFHNPDGDDEIATKIPNHHHHPSSSTCYAKFQYYFVRTGLIYILIVVFTAVSMLYGLSDQLSYMNRHRHRSKEMTNLQVAFIGNAYFFVNDIPRLLESLSQGYVYQNSCLHAGGSLSDLWVTGNGMYKLWQTNEAMIEYTTASSSSSVSSSSTGDDDAAADDQVTNDDNSTMTTYDYGVCSVLQLLQGYDKYMTYGNTYGKYYSDGLNPCIVDYNYDNFIQQQLQNDPITKNYWDYIIIVEQTKRMAFKEARNETVNFLMNRYGPLIQSSGAIPVLVDTHAFWSSKSNMTGLTDIPTFAALIAQGVTDFSAALSSVLPAYQAPLVAPIGLAYLTIWEEDFSFWQKLFLDDGIHSSVYGSYLFACVLFATLFDQLPTHNNNNDGSSSEYDNIASLFTDARKIVGQASYPTVEEAEYLRNVARRVTLRGYVPPSLLEALSALQQNEEYAKSYSNR